jgi:hypothetical protein
MEWGGMGGLLSLPATCIVYWIQGCGGGGSVRRRNTLHVVGGRQFLSQARFMGRENIFYKIKYKKRENKIFIRVRIKYFVL